MSGAPIGALLARLERVKQTAPGQWRARCPAHESKGLTLSIGEADSGAALVHCFAGCGAADVLASVAVSIFPTPLRWHYSKPGGSVVIRAVPETIAYQSSRLSTVIPLNKSAVLTTGSASRFTSTLVPTKSAPKTLIHTSCSGRGDIHQIQRARLAIDSMLLRHAYLGVLSTHDCTF